MCNQMMQIGFMQHRDAGMLERGFIGKLVMRIVAELIYRDVILRCVEPARLLRERIHLSEPGERFNECSGIVGDAAPGGRQGRKERNPHQRTSSTENVPSDNGILASTGTRAASREKNTSTVRSLDGPLRVATMRSASIFCSPTWTVCVPV